MTLFLFAWTFFKYAKNILIYTHGHFYHLRNHFFSFLNILFPFKTDLTTYIKQVFLNRTYIKEVTFLMKRALVSSRRLPTGWGTKRQAGAQRLYIARGEHYDLLYADSLGKQFLPIFSVFSVSFSVLFVFLFLFLFLFLFPFSLFLFL